MEPRLVSALLYVDWNLCLHLPYPCRDPIQSLHVMFDQLLSGDVPLLHPVQKVAIVLRPNFWSTLSLRILKNESIAYLFTLPARDSARSFDSA